LSWKRTLAERLVKGNATGCCEEQASDKVRRFLPRKCIVPRELPIHPKKKPALGDPHSGDNLFDVGTGSSWMFQHDQVWPYPVAKNANDRRAL
jgi:hypothetical protein